MLFVIPSQTDSQIADYVSLVVSFHDKEKIETRVNLQVQYGCDADITEATIKKEQTAWDSENNICHESLMPKEQSSSCFQICMTVASQISKWGADHV